MNIENAKKELLKITKDCRDYIKKLGYETNIYNGDLPIPYEAIETVLSALENSIPKKLIEDKIERYQKLNESKGYLTIEESYAKEELQKLLEKEGIK